MWEIWVIIPLVAILGSFYLEYQKNKMKMMQQGSQNEEEVEDLRKYIDKLKTRIENLEAIAAGEPDTFKTGAGLGVKEIEIDEPNLKKENQAEVGRISNHLRNK